MNDARLCLEILNQNVDEHSAIPVISFCGDPYNVAREAWQARAWMHNSRPLDSAANLFVGVSAFHPIDGNSLRMDAFLSRKKECFSGLLAVMIDDIGDGLGSKLPMSAVKLDPTWMVETSPNNYQAWYVLGHPCKDRNLAEAFIDSLVTHGLSSPTDPGMRGVSRVGRLPCGVNGKAKYAGFATRLVDVSEDARFSLEEIAMAYSMAMPTGTPKARLPTKPLQDGMGAVSAICEIIPKLLVLEGRVISSQNQYGWAGIVCPWFEEHTERDISGTAYVLPGETNNFAGGFKCHHGHCQNRTISDVIRWAEHRVSLLEIKHGK